MTPPRSHRSCRNKPLSPRRGRRRCPPDLRLWGTRRWTRTRAERKEPARRRPAPRGPAHAAASRRPGLARGAGRCPTLPGPAAQGSPAVSPPRVGEPPPTAPGPEPGRARVGADGGGTRTAPFLSLGSRRPLPLCHILLVQHGRRLHKDVNGRMWASLRAIAEAGSHCRPYLSSSRTDSSPGGKLRLT